MFKFQTNLMSIKFNKIFILLISILCISIFTKIVYATDSENEIIDSSNELQLNNNTRVSNLVHNKINYPEHHIEIILFNNLSAINKQLLSNFDLKDLNKNGTIDFQLRSVKPRFLLNVYDKLKKDSKYKVLFYAATQYSLLPSQKIKKFLINSKSKHNVNNSELNLEDFMILLVINKNRNIFNIMFDGIINKVRLRKSYKLKSKEIYYIDHPRFGAFITIVNL